MCAVLQKRVAESAPRCGMRHGQRRAFLGFKGGSGRLEFLETVRGEGPSVSPPWAVRFDRAIVTLAARSAFSGKSPDSNGPCSGQLFVLPPARHRVGSASAAAFSIAQSACGALRCSCSVLLVRLRQQTDHPPPCPLWPRAVAAGLVCRRISTRLACERRSWNRLAQARRLCRGRHDPGHGASARISGPVGAVLCPADWQRIAWQQYT